MEARIGRRSVGAGKSRADGGLFVVVSVSRHDPWQSRGKTSPLRRDVTEMGGKKGICRSFEDRLNEDARTEWNSSRAQLTTRGGC